MDDTNPTPNPSLTKEQILDKINRGEKIVVLGDNQWKGNNCCTPIYRELRDKLRTGRSAKKDFDVESEIDRPLLIEIFGNDSGKKNLDDVLFYQKVGKERYVKIITNTERSDRIKKDISHSKKKKIYTEDEHVKILRVHMGVLSVIMNTTDVTVFSLHDYVAELKNKAETLPCPIQVAAKERYLKVLMAISEAGNITDEGMIWDFKGIIDRQTFLLGSSDNVIHDASITHSLKLLVEAKKDYILNIAFSGYSVEIFGQYQHILNVASSVADIADCDLGVVYDVTIMIHKYWNILVPTRNCSYSNIDSNLNMGLTVVEQFEDDVTPAFSGQTMLCDIPAASPPPSTSDATSATACQTQNDDDLNIETDKKRHLEDENNSEHDFDSGKKCRMCNDDTPQDDKSNDDTPQNDKSNRNDDDTDDSANGCTGGTETGNDDTADEDTGDMHEPGADGQEDTDDLDSMILFFMLHFGSNFMYHCDLEKRKRVTNRLLYYNKNMVIPSSCGMDIVSSNFIKSSTMNFRRTV